VLDVQKKRCFFIGHRFAPVEMYPSLLTAVIKHIAEHNVSEFLVGQYGDFDRMAARAVIAAKDSFPSVSLFLLLPYHPAEHPVSAPPGFDGTLYLVDGDRVPKKFSIVHANRRAVDVSDFLISYVRYTGGNSGRLTEYAKRRERRGLISVFDLVDP